MHAFQNINIQLLIILFYQRKLKKFITITGIKERISKSSNLCTSDLAIKASERLIQDLGWKKEDIDFLIFISQTSDYLTPATSIIIQNKLGLKKVFILLI